MTLRDYVKVFTRRWLLIAIIALTSAAAVFFLTPAQSVSNTARSYTATATLLADGSGSGDGSGLSLGRVALFIQTGEVPERVAAEIGYQGEPGLLGQSLTVTRDPESSSLTIAATEPTPEEAAEVASAFANHAVEFFAEGNPEASGTVLTIQQAPVAVANEASIGSVIPPGRVQRTLLAGFLGLLLGMAIALVVERFDSRIRDRREMQEALGMPIIAEIHRLGGKERQNAGSIVVSSPRSSAADGYRAARTAVAHTLIDDRPEDPHGRVLAPLILVTSANPHEGKTTSVANLALSFAESGRSVLVLDADFHSPDLHEAFDVPEGVGISDYIADPQAWSLESLVRPTNAPGVRILTSGTRLEHPATIAARTGAVLDAARELADIVLIDSAPVLAASDMFDIIPLVDTVVLVARSGRISENDAARIAELLRRFKVAVSGVIAIGARQPRGRRYGYGYRYGYGEYPGAGKRRGGKKSRGSRRSRSEPEAGGEDAAWVDRDSAGSRR